MVILDTIIKENKKLCKNSKGTKFIRTTHSTVYKIQCDVCKRIMHRHKGEAWHLKAERYPGDRHVCSPECCGKLGRRSNYKPKAVLRKDGYIFIGKHREHTLIVEESIGRKLRKEERVHHIDGDKGNNYIKNLIVCENTSEHNIIHKQLERLAFLLLQKDIIRFCKNCKTYYMKETSCMC